jgi:hypothetical protein
MQTSRFQLGLTTALSIGLGATLAALFSSGTAIGYPTAAISTGSNPIHSSGGTVAISASPDSPAAVTLATAPSDQDLILTDLVVTGTSDTSDCSERWPVTLQAGGEVLGQYTAGIGSANDYSFPDSLTLHLVSGIRVPAGESLQMTIYRDTWGGSCSWSRTATSRWGLSGYYAQP